MNTIKYVTLIAVGLFLGACAPQQGFEALDIPLQNLGSEDQPVVPDLGGVETVAMKAEVSVQSAQVEIQSLEKVDFSGLGDVFKIGKIKDAILSGFDKVADKLDGVRERINQAKISVQMKIDQLDPTNPLHANAIKQLKKMLEKIESIEAKLAKSITRLSQKVDLIFDKIDRFIDRLDVGGIVGGIAQFFLRGKLDDLRFEVQAKFQDLIDKINTAS